VPAGSRVPPRGHAVVGQLIIDEVLRLAAAGTHHDLLAMRGRYALFELQAAGYRP
jgi:hypothetical protein